MTVQKFEKQEAPYLEWVRSHSEGYVLNTRTELSPKYMVLHRATCGTVTHCRKNVVEGGFAERIYRKVCSDTVASLNEWVRKHNGTMTSCSLCRPE